MRFIFANTSHAAHLAKKLKRALQEQQAQFPSLNKDKRSLASCQNMVAVLFGYRHWHEFEAAHAAAPTSGLSLPDRAVPETEQAERKALLTERLAGLTGSSLAQAESIITALKPLAFSRLEVADAKWRRDLIDFQSGSRFREHADEHFTNFRDRMSWGGCDTVTKGMPTALGHVEIKIQKLYMERGNDFVIQDGVFHLSRGKSAATSAADILAFGHFYVFHRKPGLPAPEKDKKLAQRFIYSCDEIDNELAATGLLIAEKGVLAEAFNSGSLVLLSNLYRDPVRLGRGDGLDVFCHALEAYKSFHSSFKPGSLTYYNDPGQFYDQFEDRTTYNASPDVKAAREHLSAYMAQSEVLQARFGTRITPLILGEVDLFGPGAAAMSLAESLDPDIAGIAAHGDGLVPLSVAVNRAAALRDGDVERCKRESGVNAPDEPELAGPEQLPPDFDFNKAVWLPGLAPHPRFWDYMPTELTSIRIIPQPGNCTWQGGERPNLRLLFNFRNGSQYEIDSNYLKYGRHDDKVPPQLLTAEGALVLANPFTAKLRTARFLNLMAIHTMLLFGGTPTARPQPFADVVLKREKAKLEQV